MNRKTMKAFALVACGGALLQVSGCAVVILQLLAQNVISTLISSLISGINQSTGA